MYIVGVVLIGSLGVKRIAVSFIVRQLQADCLRKGSLLGLLSFIFIWHNGSRTDSDSGTDICRHELLDVVALHGTARTVRTNNCVRSQSQCKPVNPQVL